MTEQTAAHRDMANAIRALAMDAVQQADSGHPGMPMGMADVATVLFSKFLKFDASEPHWPDRDRFVLSAGHGSMLLYSLLHLTGYADMTLDELKNFRQLGSRTAGHPEYGHASGIETTTGPLGQGLGNSVGFAIAERLLAERFGRDLVDHFTYVIAGDGCLMEGVGQEAITLAGHLGLGRLIVLFDDNGISIDGPTSLSTSEDHKKRFAAAGWHVLAVDGHDPDAVTRAIRKARNVTDKPSLIACKTVIGYGAPTKAGTAATHGSPLGKDEVAGARAKLGWNHRPVRDPRADLHGLAQDRRARQVGATQVDQAARCDGAGRPHRVRPPSEGDIPAAVGEAIAAFKAKVAAEKPAWATRKSSQEVLEVINPVLPDTIGGSADLTGSNNTKTASLKAATRADATGRYVYYGIREHAMAAAMNGMALHGGVIPYGGTFLVFTDYCRPSIRLSALMGVRVIYVMTHDSIGLGEDGPTHQPVEHLAALRAIPDLQVLRPADAIETAECWQIALESRKTPSILALTRQNLPTVRDAGDGNLCRRGAYILAGESSSSVRLIASGSEVHLALAARDLLAKDGIAAAVVSMPSWELFAGQDDAYRREVLGGDGTVRVACEAASGFGWERWLGSQGRIRRHEGLWRIGQGRRSLQAFRHHGRGDRRRGAPAGTITEDDMAVRVAINGFGRIGRNVLRAIMESGRKDIEVVAINDLGPVETNAHLFRFDSVHGRFNGDVKVDGDTIDVGRGKIKVTAERDPSKLPHKALGVDIALECTGFFTSKKAASAHVDAGAKRVLVSAPADNADLTVVYGVNHDKLTKDHVVVSNASCTTNCLAPVAKVLNDAVGIEHGFMTTIHAYTGDQPTLDTMHKDLYRGRAAALSMIPTSTGAAKAVGLVLPELNGKLDGVAIRVPTPNVSMIDFKFVAKRKTDKDEINKAVKLAAANQLKGILGWTDAPNVSIDFNHDPHSSTFHMDQTKVMDGTLVRVMSWYDNEWGFSNRMADTAVAMGKLG